MIRKLLTTAATSAILVVAAIVGLEAIGLLFQGGPPPQTIASVQMREEAVEDAEAILLRPLEALDRAQLRRQAEREQARRGAEFPHGPREAVDEERYLADALRWAERYRQRRQAEQRLAAFEHPPEAVEGNLAEARLKAEPRRVRREAEQRAAVADHPQQIAERHVPEIAGEAEHKRPPSEARATKLIAAVPEPGSARSPDTPPAAVRRPTEARQPRARSSSARGSRGGNVSWQLLVWQQPLP